MRKRKRRAGVADIPAELAGNARDTEAYKQLHMIEGKALYHGGFLTSEEIKDAEGSSPDWSWHTTVKEQVIATQALMVTFALTGYDLKALTTRCKGPSRIVISTGRRNC